MKGNGCGATKGFTGRIPPCKMQAILYDYFAPQILEDGDVSFRDGEIAPDGPGYRALLLYYEALPYSSAPKILEWAKQGLPVVLVNGVTETVHRNTDVTHGRAASKTPFLDGRMKTWQR